MKNDTVSFQDGVAQWVTSCFGVEASKDVAERSFRFLEEAIELFQATGRTAEEAYQMVDHVFSRPVGEPSQEVGGVMMTLAALCAAADLDMDQNGQTELARIWTKMDEIRLKHASKPRLSIPLNT